jgi:hypothetical protein
MVAAVLLLQLATAAPGGLDQARTLLETGDTVAAGEVLERIVTGSRLAPDVLAAFALLEWMERGTARHDAAAWRTLREPHVRLRLDVRRGAVLLGDRAAEAVGDVLIVQEQIEQGRSDSLISFSLDPRAQPTNWRVALEATAAELEADHPLVAGGVRWLVARWWLAALDRTAAEAPTTGSCEPACFRLGAPPPEYRLLARFQEAGQDTVLAALERTLGGLRRAPWPFDALGARAHVALCALARLNEGVAGCWPDGGSLEGRDAAEVEVMVRVFRGRHALAWPIMEAHPGWFASLDSLRDHLDPPPGRRAGGRPSRYAPSRPPPEGDGRLAVDQLWTAAWPLYLVPYNERLVVHRARLLLADVVWRLAVGESRGLFYPVGDPDRIVAVGVPLGLAVAGPRRATLAYYPSGTHETAPQTTPGRAGPPLPLDLALVATGSRGSRVTGFASEHYDTFRPLDHQVVQYVRAGRRHVDVHTSWVPDPMCAEPRPLVGLFLLDGGLRELRRTTVPDPQPGRRLQMRLTLHPAVYVYSLEVYDPGCRRAQRARYVLTVPPVEGTMLSDLMLADELHYGDAYRGADRVRERQPATIRPALEFAAGGTARFYWEVYGVTADTLTAGRLRIEFAVLNVRQERVPVRELGRVAREAEAAKPTLDLSYLATVPPGDGPLSSGLAVGLPPDTRGVHVARLTVTDTETGRTAQAQRAFFVRG